MINNVDKFIKFEQKYNLFSRDYNEFKFWPFIRFAVASEVFNKLDFHRINISTNKLNKYINFLKQLLNSLFTLPFSLGKNQLLVFKCAQRNVVDNKPLCRFTQFIIDNYKDNVGVISDSNYFNGKYNGDKCTNDFVFILSEIKSRFYFLLHKNDADLNEIINNLIGQINIYFGVNIDALFFKKKIIMSYIFHKCYRKYYFNLLNIIKPKCIVFEEYYNYDKMTLCEVSKIKGIETIELQHGVMGRGHIAYNYGNDFNINTLPDKVFFWGQYWKDSSRIPISDENKLVVGFPYHDKQVNKYINNIKSGNLNILVISEANYSSEFLKNIEELIGLLEKNKITFKMIYRLHPLEYNISTNKISNIIKHSQVTLSATLEDDLYFQLSNSNFVIGMASTVLYEATSYNTNILIMNDKKYFQYSEPLVNNYGAKYFNNSNELYNYITSLSKIDIKYNTKYFFESNSIYNMIYNIDSILNK